MGNFALRTSRSAFRIPRVAIYGSEHLDALTSEETPDPLAAKRLGVEHDRFTAQLFLDLPHHLAQVLPFETLDVHGVPSGL
jgi:hypothetical protein